MSCRDRPSGLRCKALGLGGLGRVPWQQTQAPLGRRVRGSLKGKPWSTKNKNKKQKNEKKPDSKLEVVGVENPIGPETENRGPKV